MTGGIEPFMHDSEEGLEEAAEAYMRARCERRGEAWEDENPAIRDAQVQYLVQLARAQIRRGEQPRG